MEEFKTNTQPVSYPYKVWYLCPWFLALLYLRGSVKRNVGRFQPQFVTSNDSVQLCILPVAARLALQ